jgi:hypothetical protein
MAEQVPSPRGRRLPWLAGYAEDRDAADEAAFILANASPTTRV